ncbi:MAG: Asp-tRNA(Asn)/Glu-tRNA(Gln) amidotransferase subunit GatC [Gammaproteobacteria bacterium]|nr:Asp-tRNA(Asn)/Glu-tRNA(Gln) amidotransferase subunit GatC [Gammaproteobacteria bacterium]
MALQADEVKKIAQLARLAIDESSVPEYARNLSNILLLMEQMSVIDTQGVMPMAHPLDAVQRCRADVVTEHNQREHFQQHAPAVEAGVYLVPKVME